MKYWVLFVVVLSIFLVACNPMNVTGGAVVDPNDECASKEGIGKDTCYLDHLKCSKIQDESMRDICVAELAKKKVDIKVCDLIKNEKTQGFCQEQIAELQGDVTICSNIVDSYWSDVCHYRLAITNNEGEFCHLVRDSNQQEKCYTEVLLETNEVEYCQYLNEIDSGRCYMTLAKRLLDVTICDNIVDNKEKRSICVLRVAKAKDDSELCSIVGGAFQKECEEEFSN